MKFKFNYPEVVRESTTEAGKLYYIKTEDGVLDAEISNGNHASVWIQKQQYRNGAI